MPDKWNSYEYLLHSVNNGNEKPRQKFEWREYFKAVLAACSIFGIIFGIMYLFVTVFIDYYLPLRGYK